MAVNQCCDKTTAAGLSSNDLQQLEKRIGYRFKNQGLIRLALTHRSLGGASYERLEFLGDSILGLLISERLYHQFPDLQEGKLSRIRAKLICGQSLAKISEGLEIDRFIMSKTQLVSESKLPESLAADLIESITGAIYLDSDIDICREVVMPWFEEKFNRLNPDDMFKDAKTQLQEWLQASHLPLPQYELKELSNQKGERLFRVKCWVQCLPKPIIAEGTSRRQAEQSSARKALLLIQ